MGDHAVRSGTLPSSDQPRKVGATELLDETERRWSSDPRTALSSTSHGHQHRCALVRESLAAYERLRSATAPESDPHTVYLRWPTCALVSTIDLAGRINESELSTNLDALGVPAVDWLDGWARVWTSEATALRTMHAIPGIALLVRLSGVAGPDESAPPRLRLDLSRGALTVRFPGDGVRGARVEAGGGDCPQSGEDWIVPRPVSGVTCHDLLGGVHRLHVVDIRDPLLAFDSDGELIPHDQPLPAGEVWLVHLGGPAPESVQGTWRVIEQCSPPVGWSRWWMARVSLASAGALRSAVDHGNGPRTGTWRAVAAAEDADLDRGEALPYLLDGDGDAVYSQPPRLRLPGGAGHEWSIDVTRLDAPGSYRLSQPGGVVVDLDDVIPVPHLGRFRVRASSPGQRALRGTFSLAGGVTVTTDRHVRTLRQHGGLNRAKVRVSVPRGVRVDPQAIHLDNDDVRLPIALHYEGSTFALQVELPHCSHRLWDGSQPGSWRIRPHVITVPQVVSGTCIDVQIPPRIRHALERPPHLVAGPVDDDSAQRVPGQRLGSGDVYRFRLGRVLDAIRAGGDLPLWLAMPGQEARIATLRGTSVATGAAHLGDRLRLLGRDPENTLEVTVSSPTAPWIQPINRELPSPEIDIPLPAPFDGGSLVDLTVRAPSIGRTMYFRAGDPDRVPDLGSDAERQVARYLAGLGPVPPATEALPWLWSAAAHGGATRDAAVRRLVAQECAEFLATDPVASLLANGPSGLTAEESVPVLIRAGLASHRFAAVDQPRSVAALWDRAPLPALLLSSPVLPYLTGATEWAPGELEPDESALLDAAERALTASARDVLADPETPVDLSPDVGLVGTRTYASDREATPTPATSADATAAWNDVSGFRSTSPYPELFRSVGARTGKSALSIGLAVVARLAAQGDHSAAHLERATRHVWIGLAYDDPSRVAVDLVHAELIVSHWHGHHG